MESTASATEEIIIRFTRETRVSIAGAVVAPIEVSDCKALRERNARGFRGRAGEYHFFKEIPIYRWDYLTTDSSARRIYVTHDHGVVALDLDTNESFETISSGNTVHGIAIATFRTATSSVMADADHQFRRAEGCAEKRPVR